MDCFFFGVSRALNLILSGMSKRKPRDLHLKRKKSEEWFYALLVLLNQNITEIRTLQKCLIVMQHKLYRISYFSPFDRQSSLLRNWVTQFINTFLFLSPSNATLLLHFPASMKNRNALAVNTQAIRHYFKKVIYYITNYLMIFVI